LDAFRKKCISQGLDDIGLTLEKAGQIDAFEAKNKSETPWLYAVN
jgi:3-isopropylmalate/(R)-2-methylmalate dehydratase small subunit